MNMRFPLSRPILSIAFVGALSSASLAQYWGVSTINNLPENCSGAASCGSVCAMRPESCVSYCTTDSAQAVECGQWAKAYKRSPEVAITQFGGPGGGGGGAPGSGGMMSPPAGGAAFGSPPGGSFGVPPGGDSHFGSPSGGMSFGTPPSGSQNFGSPPLGSPSVQPGQPQPGGDQPRDSSFSSRPASEMKPPMMGDNGSQPNMMQPPSMSGSTQSTASSQPNFQNQGPGLPRPCPAMPHPGSCGQRSYLCEGSNPDGCAMAFCVQEGGRCPFKDGKPQQDFVFFNQPRNENEFKGSRGGEGFPDKGMMQGEQGQSGQMGQQMSGNMQGQGMEGAEQSRQQRHQGIPLGGGFSGVGPLGCTSQEECKVTCEKPENKQECEKFFSAFKNAPREFEETRNFIEKDQFEQEQKRVQEQMLSQMQRGMQQMSRMISQMETRINGLQKRKVKIPEEVTAAMAQLKELVVKAQAITNPEEMGEIGPQIGELTQDVNERFGDLERLAEAPRIIAQANRMIRQFESQLRRLESRVNARKIDVGNTLSEAKALLEEIKKAREAAAQAVAQGDAESAFEQLQSGVFERGDEIGEKMFALEVVVQAPQKIAEKNRELRTLQTRITQLERKKQDMTEAKALLAEARARLATITGLTKQKPLPTEEIMSLVEELEDIVDQIREQVGESNKPEFRPFELDLPAGLQISGGRSVSSGGGAQ